MAVRQPKKKVVSFKSTMQIQPIENLSITPEVKSRLYLSKDEMDVWLLEIKSLHKSYKRQLGKANDANGMKRYQTVGLQSNPKYRGLETYFLPVRGRNKSMARKALIRYQRTLNYCNYTQEEKAVLLAAAGAKLSHWSKLVALEMAKLDTVWAYGSESPNQDVAVSSMTAKAKRSKVESSEVVDHPSSKRTRL